MRHSGRLLIALSLLGFGLCTPAAGAHWSAPQLVAPGQGQPTLMMDPQGDTLLSVQSPTPVYEGSTLNVVRGGPTGRLGPVESVGGASGASGPAAAVSPKGDLLDWSERSGAAAFAVADPGRPFGPPVTLKAHGTGQVIGYTTAVDAAGRGLVAWSVQSTVQTISVYAAWRKAGSRELGRAQLLYSGGSTSSEPLAELSGGDRVVVVFLASPPAGTYDSEQVWVTSARIAGRFARPRALTAAAVNLQPQFVLATDARDHRAVLAWASIAPTTSTSLETTTVTAALANSGGHFGRPKRIGTLADGPTASLAAAISQTGRNAVVVYAAGDRNLHGALARNGHGFGASEKVAAVPTGRILLPTATFDSRGSAVVAWSENRSTAYPQTGSWSIKAKFWPSAAAGFCHAELVARGPGIGGQQLASDAHGHTLLAFTDTTASSLDLVRYTPSAGQAGSRCGSA
jgi:hypothetical protein